MEHRRPIPTSATAARTIAKVGAEEMAISPTMVNVIPTGREYGVGRWSVYSPTRGCKSDAVSCEVSVISPICPKSRRYEVLRMGYTAGITDCIMSFNRWQTLIAASTRNAVAVSLGSSGTLRSVAERRFYSSTWMFFWAQISLRICGHTLTVTSPRWALRRSSIMVRD